MKVNVQYHDTESFLIEEVVRRAKQNYGDNVSISISPESDSPLDLIYFGIQRYITGKHLSLIFDSGPTYSQELKTLRAETLYKLGEILDEVLMDNESKVAE
jgi:hypothetical protein